MLHLSPAAYAQLVINTIGGDGSPAYGGDHGPATTAKINTPYGVAADASGNVYVADYANNRIRKIDAAGTITTIAGTGSPSYSGDGGAATAAAIYAPRGIAVDAAGNVFFSDYVNHRIRKISTSGIITTIAGNGTPGFGGDGGPATSAMLKYAWGVAVDGAGNVYIADQNNCRVRKVNTSGTISTIAGNGTCFIGGDGGQATAAALQFPLGVACDGAGNVYIADNGNNRVRKIDPGGIISTIAGGPTFGFTGDGGPSTAAKLYYPMGIAADAAGNVYICDVNNYRIRMINTSGIINTVIGNGIAGFSGDGGAPTLASIDRSTGVAVNPSGTIYIADNNNNRVRSTIISSHAPYFMYGSSQTLTFCVTDLLVNIDTILSVYDIDAAQTETWSLLLAPTHGSAFITYSTTSTGSTLVPSGLGFLGASGYIGSDSFKVAVSDGTFSDTTTVYVSILPTPYAGVITGTDTLCPGDTVTLADTATGGTWGSSTVASISSAGLLTALSPGAGSVTYTVTNTCGSDVATFPIYVRGDCSNAGTTTTVIQKEKIVCYPNPNNGTFTISLQSDHQADVKFVIIDVPGKKVKEFTSRTNNAVAVQLNEPAGLYFISATTSMGTRVDKITITR